MFNKILAGSSFNTILMVFVSSLCFSCGGPKTLTGKDLLIEMERTPCYGFCPVYTVKIAKNGKGLFEGVENVEHTGLFSFSLSREKIEELEEEFKRLDFFQLDSVYYESVSDLPTTYITYIKDERRKKIMDYYGAPEALRTLENWIETLVLSTKMTRIK